MITEWEVCKAEEEKIDESLVQQYEMPQILSRILAARGISSKDQIREFLFGELTDQHDPFLLKGMEKAVIRIKQAIADDELILVHGDYDVDGVTATAVMGKALERLGARCFLYLPQRLKGGYGVSKKALYYAREKKAGLVITVDCGISAFEEVDLANEFGIDFIVTDHHRPSREVLPAAYTIVDPWQDGCEYPYKDLSGVGIAYKLAVALETPKAEELLDLVAFGTVCDLATLDGENRVLVKYGLDQIDSGANFGFSALKKVAGVRSRKSNTGHLGFMYGPRVNASGRLGSAECALRLFMTSSQKEAASLAEALDSENKERQKLERLILKEAIQKVEHEINFNKDKIIVVWNRSWHLGVIGIVAQRLVERYQMPSVVISVDKTEGIGRGSCRSVKGFNIFNALSKTSDCLNEFGGHEYAAGVEVPMEKLEIFRDRLNEYVKEQVGNASFVKTFSVDTELKLEEITPELLSWLEKLEPYGRANPKPLFMARDLKCKERSIFLSKSTVKLWVTDGEVTYEALWYKAPVNTKINKGERFDLLFNLSRRRWHSREIIVMEIKDLKIK